MSVWLVRHTRRRAVAGLALATALVTAPGPVAADTPRSRAELEERVRKLEQIIQERGLDRPAAGTETAPAPLDKSQVEQLVDDKIKSQKVLAGWQDGFFLQSPSGDFKLKLRGYAQADARFFPLEEGDTGTDSFFLRRVRPIFEGTVYKYFDFRIMPDFGGGTTVLQDAYLDVRYWPYARLRAGKFKVPLSLERLQGGSELLFVERSIANNLAPNRDVGFQLSGDLLDGQLAYAAGVFNGVVDGGSVDGDTTSDKEVAARIFAEPFRKLGFAPAQGLGLGIAATYGGQKKGDALSAVNYRTSGRSSFFRYVGGTDLRVQADGDRVRVAPQGYWFRGPFGLMGEYIYSNQGVRMEDTRTDAVTRATLNNRGWLAQGSWVLTGENASFKMVNPINPFDPRLGRWGALEMALRGSKVDIDNDAFDLGFATRPTSASSAASYGAGVNWYLNKHFKLQVNWERTEFDDEVLFGDDLRDHEDVFLGRFQLSF